MASTIAFTILQAATSPVSNTAGATFAGDYKIASELSPKDRKAIRVYSLAKYFSSPTNYTTNKTQNQLLIADASNYTRGISNFNIDIGLTVADWNAATSGASVSTDVVALLASAQVWRQLPEQTLDRLIVFLRAQLAV